MKLTRRITTCTNLTELHTELNRAAAIWERICELPRYDDHDFWEFQDIDPDDLRDQVIEPDFPDRPDCVVEMLGKLFSDWIACGRPGLLLEAEDVNKNPIFLIEKCFAVLDKLEMHLLDYHRAYTEAEAEDMRRFVQEMRKYV